METEEKAETVVPYIPFSSAQVTIVTPATKLPIAARQSVEETLWEEGDAAVVDIFLFAGAVLMSFTTIFGSIVGQDALAVGDKSDACSAPRS